MLILVEQEKLENLDTFLHGILGSSQSMKHDHDNFHGSNMDTSFISFK